MNTVTGKILLHKTGVGIPNLVVTVYDVDSNTLPKDAMQSQQTSLINFWEQLEGERLGSIETGPDGTFILEYEDKECKEKHPNLLLFVTAPEGPGLDGCAPVLHVSGGIRQNAGRIESYLVRLTADQLTKAGIDIPSALTQETEPAKSRVQRLKDAHLHTGEILDGTLEVARARVDTHRTRLNGFSEKLQAALSNALSTIPPVVLEPVRLVRPGESPFSKNTAVIQKNLREIVNSNDPSKRAPARGFISLTEAEVQQLRAQAAPDGTVPESAVNAVAANNAPPSPTTFLQRTDLLPICRPKTPGTGECLSELEDPAPGEPLPPPEPGESGSEADPMTPEDIPRFVGRLLNPLTAPEEQLLTGLTPTATLESVQRNVRDLRFQPSPADVPAFHDFHQLQIAFQHVWQELTDRGVLDIAHDAYETIVELGGDPNRPEYESAHPVFALSTEARLALRAFRAAPPPIVRDHRGGDSDPGSAPGGVVVSGGGSPVRPPPVVTPPRSDPAVNAIDPAVRLPALLTQLESRLREKYAFTIFAANAQERSVNFGILNIFRQEWTPLSYQAGPLVKSIPLAPRQTQKVVVTRKVTKRRYQKELETNLRVIKDETSQTSRAEQEIAKRASTKTEFSYSNTASGGVEGVGSDTSTTTFKQDAAKSSDDIKKSFRESVFKSAQEVKNERVTEITTETVEELDVTETTEISNLNDEIAVTYLFYELQRCYRLHERLYRVMPVVLVAQEVPAPHEIDQAWLVAHDWILKRVIKDDSFIPTLETLCQSAGAETALEQLAANVSQQRQIVAQLRNELAIARRLADVQNNLIHDAVGRRTGGGGLLGGLVSGVSGAVGGVVDKVEDIIFGGSPDENRTNQNTLRDSADAAADRARDLTFRLEREVTALNSITETYSKALQAHHTHLTEIARLQTYVKNNILDCMRGIWMHEPPDQRFFRLHNTPIPTLKKKERKFRIAFDSPIPAAITQPHKKLERFGGRNAATFPVEAFCQFPEELEYKPLCEVADLGNPQGCIGNYMIFPLLESNPLTDYMMEPYVDRATGELVDPSDPSGWSLDEFSQYVCCLKEQLTPEELETLKPALKEQYQALLTAPRRNNDVLVVPTNSLFIECLPATHSLIEQFKKDHRMLDVKKVQADVRKLEMENIRYAARLLSEEREDPEIEKKILVEGIQTIVNPDD